MGLLDKLWDETVAGPTPDAGLGKLRRHPTFSSTMRSALQLQQEQAAKQQSGEVHGMAVTRSITILRTSSFHGSADSGSPSSLPSSPTSAPDSPFTPRTPRGGEWRRLRRKTSEAAASEAFEPAEPRSPTVYDWVVISSLDR